jgi:hypothetical protein
MCDASNNRLDVFPYHCFVSTYGRHEKPSGQKLCPTKFRFLSPYVRAKCPIAVEDSLFKEALDECQESPTTPLPPMTACHLTPQRHGIPVRTGSGFAFGGQARQSARPNRVCFHYGRLCSPSVALHPASRRRSYSWLQAGVGLPEEDLHLPEQNTLARAPTPAEPGDLHRRLVCRSQRCTVLAHEPLRRLGGN